MCRRIFIYAYACMLIHALIYMYATCVCKHVQTATHMSIYRDMYNYMYVLMHVYIHIVNINYKYTYIYMHDIYLYIYISTQATLMVMPCSVP